MSYDLERGLEQQIIDRQDLNRYYAEPHPVLNLLGELAISMYNKIITNRERQYEDI